MNESEIMMNEGEYLQNKQVTQSPPHNHTLNPTVLHLTVLNHHVEPLLLLEWAGGQLIVVARALPKVRMKDGVI